MPGGGSIAACCSSTRSRSSRARSRRCSPPSWPGNGSGRGLLWIAVALAITLGLAFSRWFTTRYRVDRGPRRGHARACSGAACAPSRATASARSTSPRARCTGSSGSPASRSAPGARTATRAAACGSTASPRPRPPRCARSCCTAAGRRRRRPPRPPGAPTAGGREEPEIELARLDPQLGPLRALHALGRRLGRRRARLPRQPRQRGALRSPSARARSRHLADRLDRAPLALDRRGRSRSSRWWPSWWPRPSATRSPSGTSGSRAIPAGPCTSRAGSSPPARRRSRSAGCTAPRSASRCCCGWSRAPA